jgi:hypothetical protein
MDTNYLSDFCSTNKSWRKHITLDDRHTKPNLMKSMENCMNFFGRILCRYRLARHRHDSRWKSMQGTMSAELKLSKQWLVKLLPV